MTDFENNTWKCPVCGKENSSMFCTECGTARPAEPEAEKTMPDDEQTPSPKKKGKKKK